MEVSVALKTSKSFFPNAYMIPGPLGLHLPGLLSLPNPAKEALCWADKPGIVPSVSDTLTKEGISIHRDLGFPRPLIRRVPSGVPLLHFFGGMKSERERGDRMKEIILGSSHGSPRILHKWCKTCSEET